MERHHNPSAKAGFVLWVITGRSTMSAVAAAFLDSSHDGPFRTMVQVIYAYGLEHDERRPNKSSSDRAGGAK
jgi:hypothetical protein